MRGRIVTSYRCRIAPRSYVTQGAHRVADRAMIPAARQLRRVRIVARLRRGCTLRWRLCVPTVCQLQERALDNRALF